MDESTSSGEQRLSGSAGGMSEDDLMTFVTSLPGVTRLTASAANGAPEIAWGDTFFAYAPDGAQRMPFATIVIKDYPGSDTASELDRPGVFRLNIAVGRTTFQELLGYTPAVHGERSADIDYSVMDRVLPHPVYARQGWVCILNPGTATAAQARALLTDAHARAERRHHRRAP